MSHVSQRPEALVAADQFVSTHVPTCLVALLAGSVVRDGGCPGSDLDIVVLAEEIIPHWATYDMAGWPIELFALTPVTYPKAFALDQRRRWPLHLNLCRSALVLKDQEGLAARLQAEAQDWYEQGPAPLTEAEIDEARYALTWMLDDLSDASDATEQDLIGRDLAAKAADTYLLAHQQWLGQGKWRYRQLQQADATVASLFSQALHALHQGEKQPLLQFGAMVLQELGGRGFAGQYFAYQLDEEP